MCTFSINSGSSEILKDSTTCGCNPKVRQMRPTVEALTPACSAILRVLQWVRPFGLLSSVVTRIARHPHRTRSVGLRAWAHRTARPRETLNRCRHVPTVTFEQRSFADRHGRFATRAPQAILARKATCRFVRARLAAAQFDSLRGGDFQSRFGPTCSWLPPNTHSRQTI